LLVAYRTGRSRAPRLAAMLSYRNQKGRGSTNGTPPCQRTSEAPSAPPGQATQTRGRFVRAPQAAASASDHPRAESDAPARAQTHCRRGTRSSASCARTKSWQFYMRRGCQFYMRSSVVSLIAPLPREAEVRRSRGSHARAPLRPPPAVPIGCGTIRDVIPFPPLREWVSRPT
jgi:hypothetical protein